MAASARRILNYLGLVDGPDYVDDYPVSTSSLIGAMPMHEDIRNSEPVRVSHAQGSVAATVSSFAAAATSPTAATPRPERAATGRITMVHPQTYNDARSIGEDFRAGIPVIMNVNEMDLGSATRMVDFAAGLTYGLKGSVERVAPGVFLLSPANYDLTAAARERFQDTFFNQS